jgi:hypothetical protein
MTNSKYIRIALAAGAASLLAATPAQADDAPQLVRCEASLGTIALVDGDTAGWTEWGLGSPRQLINALAAESGCFTPHNAAGGTPARFLVTAIAGSEEQVDQGIEMAKAGATEALIRSGAAGQVLSRVPFAGAALGMFGGLGGKKKTVAAGLRVVSPANGMTVAAGSGSVRKSTLSFRGAGGWAQTAASASGYQGSRDGQMLTEAFVLAFNDLVTQRGALDSAPQAVPATAAASAAPGAVVAIDTVMRAEPLATASEVRDLRAGTALRPTGERDGLFVQVADNFGTTGWVSVEDLQ